MTHFGFQFLICRAAINQKDILERNQQVSLMRSIYSKAERVIGWLGPDENGGGQALKTLETLLGNTIRYPDTVEWVRRIPELLTMNETFTGNSGMKFESNDNARENGALAQTPLLASCWNLSHHSSTSSGLPKASPRILLWCC